MTATAAAASSQVDDRATTTTATNERAAADPELRTYRGRTLEEVLPQIRAELGPDAVVVRQRDGLMGGIGGFFQQHFVEVQARAGVPRVDLYDEAPVVASDPLVPAVPPPAVPTRSAHAAYAAASYAQPAEGPLDPLAGGHAPVADSGAAWSGASPAAAREDRVAGVAQSGPPFGAPPAPGVQPTFAPAVGPSAAGVQPVPVAPVAHAAPGAPVAGGPEALLLLPSPRVPGSRPKPTLSAAELLAQATGARPGDSRTPAEILRARAGSFAQQLAAAEQHEPIVSATPPSAAGERAPSATAPSAAAEVALPPGVAAEVALAPSVAVEPSGRYAPPLADPHAIEAVPFAGSPAAPAAPTAAPAPIPPAPAAGPTPTPAPPAAEPTPTPAPAAAALAPAPAVPQRPRPAARPRPSAAAVSEAPSAAPRRTLLRRRPLEAPAPATPQRAPVADPAACAAVSAALTGRGLAPAAAQALLTDAVAHVLPFTPGADVAAAARTALARRIPVPAAPRLGGRVVAFVGAGGGGKTRCSAGLAAAYAQGSSVPVACLTLAPLDGGAALGALLAPHGIDVEAVADAEAAAQRIAELGRDTLVVLDTPGVASGDAEAVARLAGELAQLPLDEIQLTVPATLSAGAADELVERLAPLRPSGIAMTHGDATDHIGAVVALACATRLPLAYVNSGLALPGALAPADPNALATRLLP